ncbi:MAG TPA: succinate dehydrogenase iron-sulfur subunit [Dehalococcoidia bacterium]|nr:succinate dehydrogenase iron-sulfur subunit [Dehalococcoidia bacterium]
MEVKLKVLRYDPESGKEPEYRRYTVDMPESATVLDSLIEVREFHDGTLSLRCSCRSAICGSCAMRINGRARLACKTQVSSVAEDGEEIVVEPAGNMPTIKDLVVDMAPFWDKIRAVKPWLQPSGPPPEREYLAPPQAMIELAEVMNCIMCGACVSDCTVLEVDKSFLAPAALAKAWRFVHDPRDGNTAARLRELSEPSGIWDCTRCNFCVQVCPKDVKPMDQIMKLRAEATAIGITNNAGSRHTFAFTSTVKEGGRLNEFQMLPRTHGLLNIAANLAELPGGIRMIRAGKMPSPFTHKIPGAAHVKRIFKRFEHAKV